MLRQWYKNKFLYKSSFVIELFQHIHRLKVRNEYSDRLKHKCLFFLFTIFFLCLIQCHTRVYNSWAGPFHLNLDEFITHWKVYSGNISIERSFLSNFFSLDKEYLQIELGENQIDDNPKHIFRVYRNYSSHTKVLYTYNPIKEPNMITLPMQLFVKLPTNLQSRFHKRLPYRFELFKSDTLICIAQQMGISPEVYYSNFKNFRHIQLIEEYYDRNATDFNMKVISKCGILIGYLYDYPTEVVFSEYLNQSYKFTYFVAVFNAYSSYSPYITYVFAGLLLSWFLMIIFLDLFRFLWLVFIRFRLVISPNAQHLLNIFHINSIQELDYLLITTAKENNYHNQLFLVQNRHLIIFQINLNECDPKIFCQFYANASFMIIDIEHIVAINSNYISILHGDRLDQISLPKMENDTADWLHKRLMDCSANYRLEEENRGRLAALINEEEEMQRIIHENDFEWNWNRITAVLPESIAEFRLAGVQIVNSQLSKTTCAICLEEFHLGDSYSQWPCKAQHTFHHNCMLSVLRRQNQCPLCRHIFEENDLSLDDFESETDYEIE